MLFRFADHELDDEIFTLRRVGKDVPLRRQALDVLVYLVRNRERVITKRELLDAVWRGATVTDNTLPQAIVAVRRALDDDDALPHAIQTVRGRGYRFIADVMTSSDTAAGAGDVAGAGAGSASTSDAQLAGRSKEQCATLLRDLLQSTAASGRMAMVLVSGGAGVGKTRLLAEISRGARDKGARVIEARCRAHDGTPDLWLWVELLRGCGDSDASVVAAELAEHLPQDQKGQQPSDSGTAAAAAAAAAAARSRFLVFDRIVQILHRGAAQERLFVVIDDLQHADAASLLLLKLAASSLKNDRIAFVVAYRDGGPSKNENRGGQQEATFARTLGSLARENTTRSIPLENLSRADVAELAESKLGQALDAPGLDRLMEKSDGNPLLAIQILQAMARDNGSSSSGGPNTNANTTALLALREMREAVALQLDDITAETRAMLSTASVLGIQFALNRLASTIDVSSDKLLAPIDETLAARILKRTPEGAYRFSHLLVRDVLYRNLSLSERVTLHKNAGRAALAQNDPEDAIDHFDRALRWLDQRARPGGDDQQLDESDDSVVLAVGEDKESALRRAKSLLTRLERESAR